MANEFLPFATGGGANVITQAAYSALPARTSGFTAGIAKSNEVNKAIRQAALSSAAIGQFISDYGAVDALDDGIAANLELAFARSLQASKFNYVVATGTANAWTVAPTPALAAYSAGRLLNIIAPATNASTAVNANISTLGNRRIKKSDGSDPEIGDLVSGRVYATIDDGTNIRILTPLPSDRLAAPYLGFHGDPVSQSFVTPNQARVSNYTGIVNNLPGASHAGGIITIGTTGYYSVTANMAALMPSTTGSYGYTVAVSKVDAGGAALQSIAALPVLVSSVSFPNSLAGSASGIAKLNAGDRVAAFFGHNNPSNQNMSISIDIEFRGA